MTGTRASKRSAGDGPVAVVLDIRLPGIDGWAVLDALRSDETTRDVPVIIVSILDEKVARARRSVRPSYLTKPVSRDDLIAALRNVKVLSACRRGLPSHATPRSSEGPRKTEMATRSRVLIVEDNPLNLKLVRDVLLNAGFDVIEARTGEEGIVRATRTASQT